MHGKTKGSKMKKLIGSMMLASMPIGMFTYMSVESGVLVALQVFGITLGVFVFVMTAVFLVTDDNKGVNHESGK